jgi:hypothetical protein
LTHGRQPVWLAGCRSCSNAEAGLAQLEGQRRRCENGGPEGKRFILRLVWRQPRQSAAPAATMAAYAEKGQRIEPINARFANLLPHLLQQGLAGLP